MTKELFLKKLEEAAHFIKELDDNKVIRIISNYDADGITAASILIKALKNENKKFAVTIIKQLTQSIIENLSKEDYEIYIFADLGSSHTKEFNNLLKNKIIIILDHHQAEPAEINGYFINPVLFNLDGSKEISASGVSYLFTKFLNPKNKENAHIAIIGAIGDIQEENGFLGLNSEIIEDAKEKLEIKTGLRMFGLQSKPLHKVLQYSTDPFIPGVSGNEVNSVEFLKEIGINPRKENGWIKFSDLSQDEIKKLTTSIIIKRSGEKDAQDIFGKLYLLKEEKENALTKDAREFSTLLNCCGRLNKSSIGIGVCLNDENSKQKANELITEYRKEIVNSLNWFYENKNSDKIKQGENYLIINAQNSIKDALIGTVSSIISRSNTYPEGTLILSLAYNDEGNIKISIRICSNKNKNINLRELLNQICKRVGSQAGGHKFAAGSLITRDKEEQFINEAKNYFEDLLVKH